MVCAWFKWCADVSDAAMRWCERGGVAVLIFSGRSCGAHGSARVVAALWWWRHYCSCDGDTNCYVLARKRKASLVEVGCARCCCYGIRCTAASEVMKIEDGGCHGEADGGGKQASMVVDGDGTAGFDGGRTPAS